MKIKAIVYGKKNCSLCDNRKDNLKRLPDRFKKAHNKDLEVEVEYWDVSTVEGMVHFCKEDRTTAEIPVVLIEDEKGGLIKAYHGPTDPVKPRELIEALSEKA